MNNVFSQYFNCTPVMCFRLRNVVAEYSRAIVIQRAWFSGPMIAFFSLSSTNSGPVKLNVIKGK